MSNYTWLPGLVYLNDCDGNWDHYVEMLYTYFCGDFVSSRPHLLGSLVHHQREPYHQEKEETFWHLISEGTEPNRVPDMPRCQRVRWPRPVIEHHATPDVFAWRQNREQRERHTGRDRIAIALNDFSYLLILRQVIKKKKRHFFILITGYPIAGERRRERLRKEYENSSPL